MERRFGERETERQRETEREREGGKFNGLVRLKPERKNSVAVHEASMAIF